MTLVQPTSKYAYYHRALALEPTQFEKILDVMELGRRYTRRELHHKTSIETSTISARVNSLIKLGKIKVVGTKLDPYTNIHTQALIKVEGEPVMVRLF